MNLQSVIIGLLSLLLPFTKIGDPCNVLDSRGKGNVDYCYEIMVYEVTNAQYCTFLNSVAAISDPYGLYAPIMGESFMGGIERIYDKQSCRFCYSVIEGFDNRPAIGVSWNSAIRFINWLHYNSDRIEQGAAPITFIPITEGTATAGAYDTSKERPTRNAGARYWLPNSFEWRKAAYFDGKKWNEDLFTNGSNCWSPQKGWAYPYPHIKEVGKGVDSTHYGTYDQQGNVAEWVEDSRGEMRLALGGSLIRPKRFAAFAEEEGDFPDKSIPSFGFRVARTASANDRNSSVAVPSGIVSSTNKAKMYKMRRDPVGNVYMEVGHPGNPGDAQYSFKGRVNYTYYIARTELSNDAYCKFLNSVAAQSDPYNLYHPEMGNGVCGGIMRIGEKGHYRYTVKPGYGVHPVSYISYYDLARYANWLHYGAPKGNEGPGITEGDVTTGAYDTSDFEVVRKGSKSPYQNFGRRNLGARFWIPDEQEWYKAAYYDPERLGNRPYHDYPTRTSTPPSQSQANYMIDSRYAVGKPYFTAPVDSFANAPSFYGTLQQGGNVWEWIEAWQYGCVGSRMLRGGSWQYTEFGLNALNEDPGGIDDRSYLFGGRLCMAADSNGWQPVATPVYDRIVSYIRTMPASHMLVVVVAVGMLMIITITLFVLILKWRKPRA